MRLKDTSILNQIILDEQIKTVPKEVQILRVGKFKHPQYGEFEITQKTLSEMVENFNARVRGVDLAIDYFHDSDKEAAGWIEKLELREGGTQLWGSVQWTPRAEQKLSERELRYFSPDFTFKWVDPENQTVHTNVLFGGGLTNRPFVKEMAAIVASENPKKGVQEMKTDLEKSQEKVKELEGQVLKLTEQTADMTKKLEDMGPQVSEIEMLKKENADLKAKLAQMEVESEKVMQEKKAAEAAKVLAEKETAFNVLLTEGKAVAAQKDAYLKGDMTEFIKLSQPVNLKPAGSNSNGDGTKTDEDILKLAETRVKADPKLSLGEAISQIRKEQKQ